MTKHQLISALKSGAAPFVLSLAVVAAPAYAQTTTGSTTSDQDSTAVSSQDSTTATPAATAQGAATQGQDLIVTGSRIPQPNLTSVSPVTVVNSQEFKLTGTTRTEDLLNSLPQVFADQGGGIANGATGTATVNLRNLGANRTLVLIDGRRLVPGDPTDSAADLNFIPAALVKRVDVLTGGASSTYGADAVGGVVNFIMDKDFTGFKIDGQYSFYQHSNSASSAIRDALDARNFGYPSGDVADGGTVDTTAVIGAGFDDNRGHVVAYAGYRRINAVTQAARDYSACALGASASGSLSCAGSFNSANGSIVSYGDGTPGYVDPDSGQALPYGDGTSLSYQIGPNQTIIPGYTPYNYAPYNYYQRPDERYTAGFFAHYDVSDHFKPYMSGMFMDDRSVAQIAPSGTFGNVYSINCDNPLLSAQQKSIICSPGNLVTSSIDPVTGNLVPPPMNAPPTTVTSAAQAGYALTPYQFTDASGNTYERGFAQIYKRNVEGAARQDDLQHTAYRLVVGAKGDINDAFTYDAYYQYGRTNFSETYVNDLSISRMRKSLDVVTDPNTGQAVCRSALDGSDPNCVPYNIFTAGGVSQAALNYITAPGFQRGIVSEQVASVNVTGLLGKYGVKSPWAEDGVGINVGTEYRREALDFKSDLEYQTGDLAGQGAATLPVSGAFNVYEAYAELRVPIVQDSFFYDLSFDGGYRHSRYEVASRNYSTDTYKLGADFAPIRAIRFRGAYNRAVRSPNIQEFFAPQRVALDGSTDPCAKVDKQGNPVPITAADTGCLAQGLTVGQTVVGNPAAQYNGLIGGNINLEPEIADTYTAGLVLQPGDLVSGLRGLALTVDYYNIKVKNTIQGIGADTIVQSCTADANSPLCDYVHRDATGSLWRSSNGYVVDLTQNIGSVKTSGVDVGASYSRDLGFAQINMNFNGTYLDKFVTDNGVSTPYDCAGYYGVQCGTPMPKWRHKLRVGFTLPSGIGLSGAWRYFSGVDVDKSSSNPSLAGNYSQFAAHLPAQSYFDLTMTASIADHYRFRLGVQNLLDRQPPIVSSSGSLSSCASVYCNGNTYPVVYDSLGRYIFTGITLDF
ncbi:TonB-dependent receptor [Stakelama sediminis]|uniref:Outer membrane receptor protein involved in Fe transport n=1 Tax=Stakelama sediminis TaxID=463200 RepID=A0A840YVN5_9SPHN|nr:TonB-dependent receptor [Stakelama sediminis]MBB5717620.1 outer membrane receptor protein involved in Fe transport [Stakelama sediminis]